MCVLRFTDVDGIVTACYIAAGRSPSSSEVHRCLDSCDLPTLGNLFRTLGFPQLCPPQALCLGKLHSLLSGPDWDGSGARNRKL